jgi:hypothetical protein
MHALKCCPSKGEESMREEHYCRPIAARGDIGVIGQLNEGRTLIKLRIEDPIEGDLVIKLGEIVASASQHGTNHIKREVGVAEKSKTGV